MEYIIIIIVHLLAYFRSLTYEVVVDDITNRKNKSPENEKKRSLFQRILRKLDGRHPVDSILLDHCLTFIIHLTVCLLIYVIFDNFVAAMLFSILVGNYQVSLWLNGKRYAINTILCLLMYHFAPVGFLLWFLTPFFQANAFTFPVVLALNGHWYFLLFFPVFFLIGRRSFVKWIKHRYKIIKVPEFLSIRPKKIVLILKTLSYYFLRGILPYTPDFYPFQFRRFGLIDEETNNAYRFDIKAFAGLLLIGFTIYGYVLSPEIFFGLMWWLITISVFSNWITLTVPLADRYMYLPNVGLMLWFSHVLYIINPYFWILFFVIHFSRLVVFVPMFKDINNFIMHHCFYFPHNDQSWNFRANQFSELNDIFGVMFLSNEGLVANPDSPILWLHKAHGFLAIGRKDLAGQALEQAKKYSRDGLKKVYEKKIKELELKIKEK